MGAIVLIVSLNLPWYGIELPPAVRGALGASLQADAWEAFDGTDIALLACAIGVLVLTVLAAAGFRATGVGLQELTRLIAPLGLAATLLVVWKLVDQPEPAQLLGLKHGAFIALAGAFAMALGGRVVADLQRRA